MPTTTNYGWTTPADTDLVKDGASAIRTLGTAIDTTTKNLNPSTTLGDIEYRSSTANTNTRLGIGSTGQILTVSGGVPVWATPSASGFVGCLIYHSTTQTITSDTGTIVSFDSEVFDTDSFHSTSTNNSRITIPSGKGGKYLIIGSTQWQTGTNYRFLQIFKNGSKISGTQTSATNDSQYAISHSRIEDLAVGDYIQMNVQCGGNNYDLYGGTDKTTLSVVYLGA
jgi:hypothetical protein